MGKKKYYAVVRGRNPGIYRQWFGGNGAESQVKGFPNALFKGFPSLELAKKFLEEPNYKPLKSNYKKKLNVGLSPVPPLPVNRPAPHGTVMYTDGGCIDNPGPGGWGVVLIRKNKRQELSGGFRLTTNNRMELTACIMGLTALAESTRVSLYTDSKYVANGITKGWAKKWRANRWMRTPTEKALNADLWEQLLSLCDTHRVDFIWVKGHAGNPENERCDRLAGDAARQTILPADKGYEKDKVRRSYGKCR